MGAILDRRAYRRMGRSVPQGLFVLPDRRFLPEGAAQVSLGRTLSEILMQVPSSQRPQRLGEALERGIPPEHELIVADIDILFDPIWQIDVLRLLLARGRNRRIYLVWPGEINGNQLTYSQPNLPDYAVFDIGQYVDTYLVRA